MVSSASCSFEKLEFGATLYEEDKSLDYRAKINVIDLKDEEESNKENNDGDAYLSELKNFEIEARMVLEEIKNIVGKFNVYDVKEKKFHKARYVMTFAESRNHIVKI